MGISKTEVDLERLQAVAPRQENHAKLVHYVATLRELLEQLDEERTPEGLPSISKAKVNDYSEKIEAIASKLAAPLPDIQVSQESVSLSSSKESPPQPDGENHNPSSPPGLRRRVVPASDSKDKAQDTKDTSTSSVKLDDAAHAHIEKHCASGELN